MTHQIPLDIINELAFFNSETTQKYAEQYKESYQNASPFPHIIIDNFLPEKVIEKLLHEFPEHQKPQLDLHQEKFKTNYNPDHINSGFARSFFYSLNSKPFLKFLETLTGIDALISDPHFLGGGFHETTKGGKLGVHADFNLHKKLNLHRRLNVLIYLNKDWKEEYGGHIELWDKKMKNKVDEILPIFNRCLIFNTNSDSYHGHPVPLACPENMSRKSMALYYYTSSKRIYEEHKEHTTRFKARSGTTDKVYHKTELRELVKDISPPILWRALNKLVHF